MKLLNFSNKIVVLFSASIVVIGAFTVATIAGCFKVHANNCESHSGVPQTDSAIQLAANYYEFSEANLYQAQQNGRTVLYFWAPWCSSCSALDIDLQDGNASIPNGITVLRVPYDQAKELKRTYNVTVQHTFVQINPDGEAIATWVGGNIVDFSRYIK